MDEVVREVLEEGEKIKRSETHTITFLISVLHPLGFIMTMTRNDCNSIIPYFVNQAMFECDSSAPAIFPITF